MKLQTEIKLKLKDSNQIEYHSKLLLLGSCFSENIGNKFEYFKFQTISNPFGILFHPKAIENLMSRAVMQKEYQEKDIFFHKEQWHCYDAHSKWSHPSKDTILENLNVNLKLTNTKIKEATHVVITLGTAWVYKLKIENKTVANCHKIPQNKFDKVILSVEEISKSLESIVETVAAVNKKAVIIFTVSPVRHIKDGFIENTLSKSHLVTAIHALLNRNTMTNKKKHLHYFPSYEIMLDELRDYRFYKSDMLHPNETAVEIIWNKFKSVWLNSNSFKTMQIINQIQNGIKHKPFNETSKEHLKFLEQLELQKQGVISQFPQITF